MFKGRYYSLAPIIFLSAFLLNGCSIFTPNLKADKDLKADGNPDIPCITNEYDKARNCAIQTINEISELLADTGKFSMGMAYGLLGIGTVAGGVLAFDGSEKLLKGLAVGTGSLLGLNTVVNPDLRRTVLKKGLKDMVCALRAAEAVKAAAGSDHPTASFDAGTLIPTILSTIRSSNLNPMNQGIQSVLFTQRILALQTLSETNTQLVNSLKSAKINNPTTLSTAVINIRAEIREKLADTIPDIEALASNQRNGIIDKVGEIVKRSADAKEAIAKTPDLKNFLQDNQTVLGSFQIRNKPFNETAQSLFDKSAADVEGIAPIIAVFRDCVDPAARDALEKI